MARKKEPEQPEKKVLTDKEWAGLAQAALTANEQVQEAHGAVNTYTYVPMNVGSMGGFRDGHGAQAKIHRFMRESDQAYRQIGIIRNVVDIMTDFAAEGLDVVHPVPSQERFFRKWAERVNIQKITKEILQGMFKWGNVGVFRFWGKIRPRTKREMMAKAKELFTQGKDREAVTAFLRESKLKPGRIPVRYTCLPPFNIRIYGSILFPERVYFYKISQLDKEKLLDPERNASDMEKRLMKEMPDVRNAKFMDSGLIELPNENFEMFHYKKDCARLWADPMILPIMEDLRFKQVLRRMDISVAESIINPITLFKLGKTPEGFPPSKEMFQNLASLLKKPVMTKTLIWNDLIEIDQKTVDAREVLTQEKYAQINDDILAGLGVSQVLINGGTGGGSRSFGAAFLSVRTLLERLEDSRTEILTFLNKEFAAVAKAMGFKKRPTVIWNKMNLRDEAAEKRIVIELLDRKLISAESAMSVLGFEQEIELQRKAREAKQSSKTGVVHSVGPFEQQVQVQKTVQEIEDDDENSFVQKEQPNKDGPAPGPGRPPDEGDEDSRKQKVKRDTKPQGMGTVDPELVERADKNRIVIENVLKPLYLKSLNKKNLRQLTNAEKKIYDKMVFIMLSHTKSNQTVTEQWVESKAQELAEGPAKLDRCVSRVTTQLVSEYRNKNGKAPSAKKRRELESRAWAICRKQLNV